MRLDSASPLSLTVETGWLRFPTFSWKERDGWLYGVIDGHAVKVRQSSQGLEFHSDGREEEVASAVTRYFRLDEDITPVHDFLRRRDGTMAWLVGRFGNMRVPRLDPWECLVSFICAQGVSVEQTAEIVGKITKHGDTRPIDRVPLHAFPSPQRLAKLDEDDLAVGVFGRSKRLVLDIARDITEERLDLTALSNRSYKEAKGQLLKRYGGRGIGEKTADCVCLFAFGQGEAFPIDRHIGDALWCHYRQKWSRHGKNLELRRWVREHFEEHAGYASQLLFLSEVL